MKIKLVSKPGGLTENNRRILDYLDASIFYDCDPYPKNWCYWWLAYDDDQIVGFAGLDIIAKQQGFLCRCGVIEEYRGFGIHHKLIKAREKYAKYIGLNELVTYVHDENLTSANNLITHKYKLCKPWYNYGDDMLYFDKLISSL